MAASIEALPNELLAYCFEFLTKPTDKAAPLSVSRRWRELGALPALWRSGDVLQPLWITVPLARRLLGINSNIRISLELTSKANRSFEGCSTDVIMTIGAACESLRFTPEDKTLKHLLRLTHGLRYVDDLPVKTAVEVARQEPTLFQHLEVFVAPDDESTTITLIEVVEMCRAMPRLSHILGGVIIEPAVVGPNFATLRCAALKDVQGLAFEGPDLYAEFIRCCPALESFDFANAPRGIDEIWPEDEPRFPLPPLRKVVATAVKAPHHIERTLPLLEELKLVWTPPARVLFADGIRNQPNLRRVEIKHQAQVTPFFGVPPADGADVMAELFTYLFGDGNQAIIWPQNLQQIVYNDENFVRGAIDGLVAREAAQWAAQPSITDVVPALREADAQVDEENVLLWERRSQRGEWRIHTTMRMTQLATSLMQILSVRVTLTRGGE